MANYTFGSSFNETMGFTLNPFISVKKASAKAKTQIIVKKNTKAGEEMVAKELLRLTALITKLDGVISKTRGTIRGLQKKLASEYVSSSPERTAAVQRKMDAFGDRLNTAIDKRQASINKLNALGTYTKADSLAYYQQKESQRKAAIAKALKTAKSEPSKTVKKSPDEKETGGSMLVPTILVGGAALAAFLAFKG